jgi:hypothetical protein
MGEMKYVYKILVEKPEGKRLLMSPRRTSEDNIRKNLREERWQVVDWVRLAQDRNLWQELLNMVMNFRVP